MFYGVLPGGVTFRNLKVIIGHRLRMSTEKTPFSGIEDMPQANGLQFTARVGELPSDLFSVVG
ncbi:hypothetical protein LCGC14_2254680, partial [marine sediment metagenome]